jgi:hypothetical protein
LKTNLQLNYETAASVVAAAEIVYRQRDVIGIAKKRIANTLAVAARLQKAALAVGSDRAIREAFLLNQCAALENVWVAQNLDCENLETGLAEMFDAVGVMANCGSRLCESCSADLRRRSRQRARAGLWAAGLQDYEKRRMVTLTTPTPQGASQEEAIKFVNSCWRRLQKKAWWAARVRGAVKGVEAPRGSLGFHPHIHTVTVGQYLERDSVAEKASVKWREEQEEKYGAWGMRLVETLPPIGNLQAVWNECLLAEIKSRGWLLVTNARKAKKLPALLAAGAVVLDWRAVGRAGRGLLIDVRTVKAKGKGGVAESETVTLAYALNEVLKYVTKSEEWVNLPDQELVAAATIKRWPRMFEVVGACKPSTEKETVNIGNNNSASLDTPYLSAAENFLVTGSVRENEVGESETYIDGAGWVASESAHLVSILYGEEEFLPLLPPVAPAPVSIVLPREESLRSLGEGLPFVEWCAVVKARWAARRFIRRRLLSQQFVYATFWTLDGRMWGMLPVAAEEI